MDTLALKYSQTSYKNYHIIFSVLICLLALEYIILKGESSLGISVLMHYMIGYLFVRLVLRNSSKFKFVLYDIFFFVYGSLCLYTQIELIHNPLNDFYIHNDAAWSFYSKMVDNVPNSWDELWPFIAIRLDSDTPFAAALFSFIAEIGKQTDIIDLRLFTRMHVFMLTAIIPAIMAAILELHGVDKKQIFKGVLIFGLCTYLFVGSCVFTRDLHVCFVYTLFAYYMLLPKCRGRLFVFILLAIMATGFRLENGEVSIVFIMAYYMSRKKNQRFYRFFAVVLFVVAISYFLSSPYLDEAVRVKIGYEGLALENTGGIFEKLYTLPFPINLIIMVVYIIIMPMPITKNLIGDGNTFLTLPFVISPYIITLMFYCVSWYLITRWKQNIVMSYYLFSFSIIFVLIIYGSPDLRRAFACVPAIYIGYMLIKNNVPITVSKRCKQYVWPIVLLSGILLTVYALMN